MSFTANLGIFKLRERVRQSLWFIPAMSVLVTAGIGVALVLVDKNAPQAIDARIVFGGGPAGARELVSTVAGSMVAFIGTVFSITVIVLQLASSQFSPRALRGFLRDRRSQFPLGVFLGTLVYALVVLWTIRSGFDGAEPFVPDLAITGVYVMVLLSLGTFVYYIHHISQSIRVATILHRIGHETCETLEKRYPDPYAPDAQVIAPPDLQGVGHPVASVGHGVVLAIDESGLAEHAQALDGRVEVLPYVGDFVPVGGRLGYWVGDAAKLEALDLARFVSLGRERTMEQDLAFGARQLVDIAEKALSPGVNDPTTATQALDQLHNVLRQLAGRAFPDEVTCDGDGVPRLVIHERGWADVVRLAFDEIREYGASSIQVQERLRAILEDLVACVPQERRKPLEGQLRALARSVQARPR